MGIKRTLLTGLMALCLGVTSLAAADGTFVKRDSLGREIGQLLYIDTDFGAITEVTTCAYKNGEPSLTDVDIFRGTVPSKCLQGWLGSFVNLSVFEFA